MTQHSFSVFVHPRAFWSARFGGVTRYICEISRFLSSSGVDVHVPICDTPNEYFCNSPLKHAAEKITISAPLWVKWLRWLLVNTKQAERARRAELYFEGLQYAKHAKYDIVHPSDTYSTEILKYIIGKPLVITVHDMIDEIYFSHDRWHQITSARKKQFAVQADAIIAISQHTKNDLIRLFDIPEDKIEVIYHGNSLKLPENYERLPISLPERYILFVGTRTGYKDFSTLAKAFANISSRDATIKLVCAGGGAFTQDELQFLDDLDILEKTEQRSVTDTELAVLYNRSACFVFPSEYEGFGMPILEAFECGAPVICSRCSCFPEIARNGAVYFEKNNVSDLTNCILSVITSFSEQERLRAEGRLRLADFSWKKAASQTLAVYHNVLQKRKPQV